MELEIEFVVQGSGAQFLYFHCLFLPPRHRKTTKSTASSSVPIYLAFLQYVLLVRPWALDKHYLRSLKETTFIYAE